MSLKGGVGLRWGSDGHERRDHIQANHLSLLLFLISQGPQVSPSSHTHYHPSERQHHPLISVSRGSHDPPCVWAPRGLCGYWHPCARSFRKFWRSGMCPWQHRPVGSAQHPPCPNIRGRMLWEKQETSGRIRIVITERPAHRTVREEESPMSLCGKSRRVSNCDLPAQELGCSDLPASCVTRPQKCQQRSTLM